MGVGDYSISVHFQADTLHLEFDIGDEPIFFGLWDAKVRLCGETLMAVGDWTETHASEENGCDYLEVELPLKKSYRLRRCFLLDNDDRVLLLADTLLRNGDLLEQKQHSLRDVELSYVSSIYYSSKLVVEPMPNSTELMFRTGKPGRSRSLFRVLPLALSEWKVGAANGMLRGSLDTTDSALTLCQQTSGRSLFAPLFFDLDPDRCKKRYTWKQLSVGENLQRVPDDQAVGCRIQLGTEQFLLYRSMTAMASRTVLGHNLIEDFCFARFDPKSGVEALV